MNTPILDDLKTTNPKLYNLVYPKSYQYIPKNYLSPKIFAESILTFISKMMANDIKLYSQEGDNDSTLRAMASFLEKARPYQLPSFFIDKEFYKAMFNTDIKQGIDYDYISLPFPCQLLYLPLDIEDEYKLYEDNTTSQLELIGISKYTTTTGKIQYIYFHTTDKHIRFIAKESEKIQEYIDKYLVAKPIKLALNILLAKNARPNLYSMGTKLSSGKKKSIRELWTPNFIGKGYKIKEENTDIKLFKETHSSPRLHWRRGHFRNQHYGIQNTEQKIIWIEPTLVGVEDGERKRITNTEITVR